MTAPYTVDITIGAHSWTFERVDGGDASDGVTVLDNLRFGWSMPSGIGPQQPDPMTAALAITVPSFADASDIDVGTTVAIEVRFDPDADDPMFAFYGRVSDPSAVPRTDRPAELGGRPGVTLSVVAVDYTVDIADVEDFVYDVGVGTGEFEKGYVEVLTQLWADRPELGALPDWPGGFDANGPTVAPGDSASAASEAIKNVLLVAVDDDGLNRVIIAPAITDGLLDAQHYAFDVIPKEPETNFIFNAYAVRRATLKWLRNRRRLFNTLEVTGFGGISTLVSWPDVGHKVITDRLSTICADPDELDDVAAFYLPSDVAAGSWTLDQFQILLTQGMPDALGIIPADLMPRWWLAPGEAGRSGCYGKEIRIAGLPGDLNPFPDEPALGGVLDGATVTIAGGEIVLDVRLRQLYPVSLR